MGLVHLVVLIGLIINFHKEIFFKKNNYFFFTLNIFLFYFIPIIYGWISQPAIHERYIIFVTIPLLILISSLIFEIKSSKIKYLYIIIFVVITFANHFTENTFKQFYKITERYKPNFVEVYKYINSTEIKNIYFDLSNLKTKESEIIFSAYSNYSNYLFNSNDFDIQILDKIDNSNNFDGFWSICLFGEEWCNFNNNKYEVSNTKKFFKLHIKLYLKKS